MNEFADRPTVRTLSKRVYALTVLWLNPTTRVGLMIYMSCAGTQGTFGGLLEVGRRIIQAVHAALAALLVCLGDPVCAGHDPTHRIDDRVLHRAACHGWLLVAEIGCEARSVHLDRALLVQTMAMPGANVFADLKPTQRPSPRHSEKALLR